MKLFQMKVLCAALVLVSTASFAKEKISLSPSIEAGARSFLSGKFDGTGESNTFGPYMTPSIELGIENDAYSISASYTLEMGTAKGFGKAKKNFDQNKYFQHNPSVFASANLSPEWKTSLIADFTYKTGQKSVKSNYLETFLLPEVSRKINDSLTLQAGYVFYNKNKLDSIISSQKGADGKFAVVAAGTGASGTNPKTTLHAGIVTAKVKLTDSVSLKSYARLGRKLVNGGGAAKTTYRLNNDLSTGTPLKNLKLKLRYRVNVEKSDKAAADWYHLGHVIANYKITNNWAAVMTNTFSAYQGNFMKSTFEYENENYIGAKFAF
jgi:hypothetical protein